MKLTDNTIVLSEKVSTIEKYPVIKSNFKILDFSKYLHQKKYFFVNEEIDSGSFLIVISSPLEGYRRYKGNLEYDLSLEKIMQLLKEHVLLQNKKKSYLEYYIIIEKDNIKDYESMLYELFLMFNFSLIVDLKEKLNEKELMKKVNKFSFYSNFNFKKWLHISNWQLFFDADHLTGTIICKRCSE